MDTKRTQTRVASYVQLSLLVSWPHLLDSKLWFRELTSYFGSLWGTTWPETICLLDISALAALKSITLLFNIFSHLSSSSHFKQKKKTFQTFSGRHSKTTAADLFKKRLRWWSWVNQSWLMTERSWVWFLLSPIFLHENLPIKKCFGVSTFMKRKKNE